MRLRDRHLCGHQAAAESCAVLLPRLGNAERVDTQRVEIVPSRDKARMMLAEVYGWFTEGFDIADLKDAKALLDELNQ